MLYDLAQSAGASGGKITGAGGGGFLLLCCDEEVQSQVTTAMHGRGLRRVDFRLSSGGVGIASVQWNAQRGIENSPLEVNRALTTSSV